MVTYHSPNNLSSKTLHHFQPTQSDHNSNDNTSTVFLNEQLLGTLSGELPQSFYVGISVYHKGAALETTDFDVVSTYLS